MKTNVSYYWEIVNAEVAIKKFNEGKEKLFVLYDVEGEEETFIETNDDLLDAIALVDLNVAEIGIFKIAGKW